MASRPSSGPSRAVNMLEAKTHLSRMVEAIETGAEAEVGIARRQFVAPDSIDRANLLIAHLFEQLPLHHRGPTTHATLAPWQTQRSAGASGSTTLSRPRRSRAT
ncbi:MAG: hypothetical protein WBN89_06955 [Prochlorococcaceae cyanobacterium]